MGSIIAVLRGAMNAPEWQLVFHTSTCTCTGAWSLSLCFPSVAMSTRSVRTRPELFRILALRGSDVILLPAAFTMQTGRDHWEVLIRARAIENQVFFVAVNQTGSFPPGKSSYGRSMIVDPWGIPLAIAPDGVGIIEAKLDLSQLRETRRRIPSLANRMPDRYDWPEQLAAIR